MKIIRNVDLSESPNSIDAWETCAASAAEVVIFTANRSGGIGPPVAAYSSDNGDTFTEISTTQICAPFSQNPCCDQVVIYIPKIGAFVWVIQTNEGNYVCSLASLEELRSSGGNLWHSFLLTASYLGGFTTDRLDYPEIAVGDNFLYMTCTVLGKAQAAIRFSLADLSAMITKKSSPLPEFFLFPGVDILRPAQNTGSNGYFVGQRSTSVLVVIKWPEFYIGSGAGSGSGSGGGTGAYVWDVPIATIPTADWEVKLPDGPPVNTPWLSAGSKITARITGLTHQYGKLWVAWTGARKYKLEDPTNVFPYPHIGIGIIDTTTLSFNRYNIYSQDQAYAWPS